MRRIAIIIITILLSSTLLMSQDAQLGYQKSEDMKDWGFGITPYALLAAQSTDVGGEKIRQSFSDLASMTNAGFQIIATARYKKITLSFDGTFATLGGDIEQGPLEIDLIIKQRIFDMKLNYSVYENFEFKENKVINGWAIKLGMGTKYWKNNVGLDYVLTHNDKILSEDNISIPQEWFDLMIGMNAKFILNKNVLLGVGLNIGGFGIGNSSKFAYDFTYINNFKVSKWLSVNAGFRNFRYRRIDGEGADEVETKVNVLGPMLGVTFIF